MTGDSAIRIVAGMTTEEAVAALDAMQSGDPESAHGDADDILLTLVPAEVADAYNRLIDRCAWWAYA